MLLIKLTVLIVEVFVNVHIFPVLGAIHFHFELTKVHDEEQSRFIGRQDKIPVFEKAFILMQVSVLSHSI